MLRSGKSVVEMRVVTADDATRMVRTMAHAEQEEADNAVEALKRLARKTKLPFWTLSHFRKGNAKTCDGALGQRILVAYLDFCARQVSRFEAEIETRKAAGDDDLQDLGTMAAALGAEIRQRRAALTTSSGE